MLVFFFFFLFSVLSFFRGKGMGEGLLRSSCAKGSADARVAQVAAKRVVKCIVAECVLSVCMCVCLSVLLLSLSRVNLVMWWW